VLAELLPGAREIRAPRAAGYLWLICGWLVFANPLPGEHTHPIIERLYELEGIASDVGVLVAASAGAYLVGSVATSVGEVLGRSLRIQRVRALNRWQVKESERQQREQPTPPRNPPRVLKGTRDQNEWMSLKVQSELERWAQREQHQHGLTPKSPASRPNLVNVGGSSGGSGSSGFSFYATILDEWPRIKTRLLSTDQALFAEIDRHDAEAAFRAAVAPPLFVLSALLAVGSGSLWWLGGWILVLALNYDGNRQRRRAADSLAEAVMSGRVKPPFMERYAEASSPDPRSASRVARRCCGDPEARDDEPQTRS
jgi:hypothetical protein